MSGKMRVTFRVNGKRVSIETWPIRRLLDVLREEAKLTGTKEGCGEGECGACSVLVDGEVVNSCLVPVIQAQGAQITTIEGFAGDKKLAGIQEAFLEHGGAQCGICTPGMIVAASAVLAAKARAKAKGPPTESEVREGLAGNLCRCTGYMKIFASVRAAARPPKARPAPRAKRAARRGVRR